MGTRLTTIHKRIWLMDNIKILEQIKGFADENIVIAEFCINNNSTKKTALEFLKILEDGFKIKRDNGKIYTFENFKLKEFLKNPVLDVPIEKVSDEKGDPILTELDKLRPETQKQAAEAS